MAKDNDLHLKWLNRLVATGIAEGIDEGRPFLLVIFAIIACVGGPSCLSEPFQRLAFEVVDAAYSQSARRLVMVSA